MNRFITSWNGCPQRHLHGEVMHSGSGPARGLLMAVAGEWDQIVAPNPLRRLLRRPVTVSFAPAGYGPVVAGVSDLALEQTLEHLGALRHHERVRGNLAATAFLERFEAAVAAELSRRSPGAAEPVVPATSEPAPAAPGAPVSIEPHAALV